MNFTLNIINSMIIIIKADNDNDIIPTMLREELWLLGGPGGHGGFGHGPGGLGGVGILENSINGILRY